MIGKVNADKMELDVGDYIVLSLTNQEGDLTSFRSKILGIYQSPSEEMDKTSVLLRREDLSKYFAGQKDRVGYFVFKQNKLSDAIMIQAELQKKLGHQKEIEILTYREVEPSLVQFFDMSAQFRWITHLIMMVGFALILFDSISMSVFDRMREIGVIRAIGSGSGVLFWMVIFESLLLSIIGVVLGTGVGGLITFYYYFTGLELGSFASGLSSMGMGSTIYPYLTVSDMIETLLVTLSVSLLSTLYPAWKAVSILPVKAIYNR